ncbi:MAG TPA: hypothetical protein VHL58_13725 [Thermoanaerobaculia bacterium]|nr:hypothetical protein [Thermoanaerobaculia bacterium]
MFQQISAVSTIRISAPKKAVLSVVQDIQSIEKFEVKADRVELHPADSTRGTYNVVGHFAGLPWRREFAYFINEDGFYSRDARKSGKEYTVQGGFIVQEVAPHECVLIHYELYFVSRWFVPLRLFISTYLNWSMRRELREMRETILQSVNQTSTAESVSPVAVIGHS